jgi:hypothetical protein
VDFVVVGLGLGALGILIGVLLAGWLAARWERAAARAEAPDDCAYALAMAVWRRDAGQSFLSAGSAVLIATIGALAGSLDDRTGAYFVTTAVTVAALGLLLWGYLYRVRNPAPRRPWQQVVTPLEVAAPPARRASFPWFDDYLAAHADEGVAGSGTDHVDTENAIADPGTVSPAAQRAVTANGKEPAPAPADAVAEDAERAPDDAGVESPQASALVVSFVGPRLRPTASDEDQES